MQKQYRLLDNLPQHECVSWKEGDTILFKCNSCTYQRRWEIKSGKFIVENEGDAMALHEGSHQEVNSLSLTANDN